ncbi:MAG: undecaprenyl-diphosphatase UppP [Thermodesulfobacteria bacterium]|nr:undecaprenyl-diphosphatase UppP [Thermodesulfobacteriota bacterium]
MNGFEAVFLGVLQGVTEFLPVSSSGHLVLAEYFLHLKDAGLAFDVILHMGTLLAVLAYFWNDWWAMAKGLFSGSNGKGPRKLLLLLIAGTVPGAVAGFLLEHAASTYFRSPWVVVCTLAGVALLLYLADKKARHFRGLDGLGLRDALLVGLSQALAIVPGVSRSGITMTCALFLGFNREAAAHFSFLLSAPIIAGAGLYETIKLLHSNTATMDLNYLLGFLASLISGYLVIAFLMNYLKNHTFTPFVIYRLVLAAVVLAAILIA